MKPRIKLLSLCCAIWMIVACNKKSDDPSPETTDNEPVVTGKLFMHLHNFWSVDEIQYYDTVYMTSDNRKASFQVAQCYLTNFQLVKLDGSVYTLTKNVILKIQDNTTYEIGDVPVGNYKSLRFSIGLDASASSELPSSSTDMLNNPSMWFTGTAKPNEYVFFHLKGKIDTTTNANGAEINMQPFQFKIGTQENLKQRTMPDYKFSIMANQAQYVHMRIDYSKLFNGIDLRKTNNLSVTSLSDNNSELAKRIVDNLPTMFLYEE